ncbi:unnamed protein product [Sympodiomycopsis kandeliae]
MQLKSGKETMGTSVSSVKVDVDTLAATTERPAQDVQDHVDTSALIGNLVDATDKDGTDTTSLNAGSLHDDQDGYVDTASPTGELLQADEDGIDTISLTLEPLQADEDGPELKSAAESNDNDHEPLVDEVYHVTLDSADEDEDHESLVDEVYHINLDSATDDNDDELDPVANNHTNVDASNDKDELDPVARFVAARQSLYCAPDAGRALLDFDKPVRELFAFKRAQFVADLEKMIGGQLDRLGELGQPCTEEQKQAIEEIEQVAERMKLDALKARDERARRELLEYENLQKQLKDWYESSDYETFTMKDLEEYNHSLHPIVAKL